MVLGIMRIHTLTCCLVVVQYYVFLNQRHNAQFSCFDVESPFLNLQQESISITFFHRRKLFVKFHVWAVFQIYKYTKIKTLLFECYVALWCRCISIIYIFIAVLILVYHYVGNKIFSSRICWLEFRFVKQFYQYGWMDLCIRRGHWMKVNLNPRT